MFAPYVEDLREMKPSQAIMALTTYHIVRLQKYPEDLESTDDNAPLLPWEKADVVPEQSLSQEDIKRGMARIDEQEKEVLQSRKAGLSLVIQKQIDRATEKIKNNEQDDHFEWQLAQFEVHLREKPNVKREGTKRKEQHHGRTKDERDNKSKNKPISNSSEGRRGKDSKRGNGKEVRSARADNENRPATDKTKNKTTLERSSIDLYYRRSPKKMSNEAVLNLHEQTTMGHKSDEAVRPRPSDNANTAPPAQRQPGAAPHLNPVNTTYTYAHRGVGRENTQGFRLNPFDQVPMAPAPAPAPYAQAFPRETHEAPPMAGPSYNHNTQQPHPQAYPQAYPQANPQAQPNVRPTAAQNQGPQQRRINTPPPPPPPPPPKPAPIPTVHTYPTVQSNNLQYQSVAGGVVAASQVDGQRAPVPAVPPSSTASYEYDDDGNTVFTDDGIPIEWESENTHQSASYKPAVAKLRGGQRREGMRPTPYIPRTIGEYGMRQAFERHPAPFQSKNQQDMPRESGGGNQSSRRAHVSPERNVDISTDSYESGSGSEDLYEDCDKGSPRWGNDGRRPARGGQQLRTNTPRRKY